MGLTYMVNQKDTHDIYDTNGFDINGKHKVTRIFLDKKNIN